MTAKEDIVCWKVLLWFPRYGTYMSPYQSQVYQLESTVKTDAPWEMDEYKIVMVGTDPEDKQLNVTHMVSSGGYHTFRDKQDAVNFAKWWWYSSSNCVNIPVVAKCIIPKGTEYYDGYFAAFGYNDGFLVPSFASKSLTVTSVVIRPQEYHD